MSFRLFLGMLAFSTGLIVSSTPTRAAAYDSTWYDWLAYPWDIRYVILVSDDYAGEIEVARRGNARRDRNGSPEFRRYPALFDPVFPLKDESFAKEHVGVYEDGSKNYGELGFQIIEFDQNGKVITPSRSPEPLTARQTLNGERVRVAMLVAGKGKPGDYWYQLGNWFDGFPSRDGGEFSPALCHPSMDDGRYAVNSSERYFHPERKFNRKEVEERIGLFGCREWTYQLYRRPETLGLQEHQSGAPYIDVTSYGGKHGEKTRIGNFLGWARFDDPRRPIIGKHGKYWVCLHECPDGEKPGLIPDIKTWVEKHGWPLPMPTPSFPDSKFKNPYKPENPD